MLGFMAGALLWRGVGVVHHRYILAAVGAPVLPAAPAFGRNAGKVRGPKPRTPMFRGSK